MSKVKGSRTERELFHLLWESGFSVMRAAGSGSTTRPAPDLLASNGKKTFAIECKALKSSYKYFPEKEIKDLMEFARGFGAEAWLALRFDNKGWYFIEANKLLKTNKGSYKATLVILNDIGLRYDEFISEC